jgi:hypothetical protein
MFGVLEVPLIALLKKMVMMGGALQTHLPNKSNLKYQDLILENGAQQTIKEERAHGLLPLVIKDQAIHYLPQLKLEIMTLPGMLGCEKWEQQTVRKLLFGSWNEFVSPRGMVVRLESSKRLMIILQESNVRMVL